MRTSRSTEWRPGYSPWQFGSRWWAGIGELIVTLMAHVWRTAPIPETLRKLAEFTAIWCPCWYDQDQPIAVGRRGALSFAVRPEEYTSAEIVRWHAAAPDAVFYCGCGGDRLWFDVDAEIITLHNSALGAVRSIKSQGLDYTITLDSSRELVVNGEEHPGAVWDSDRRIWLHEFEAQDWTMVARIRQYDHAA